MLAFRYWRVDSLFGRHSCALAESYRGGHPNCLEGLSATTAKKALLRLGWNKEVYPNFHPSLLRPRVSSGTVWLIWASTIGWRSLSSSQSWNPVSGDHQWNAPDLANLNVPLNCSLVYRNGLRLLYTLDRAANLPPIPTGNEGSCR